LVQACAATAGVTPAQAGLQHEYLAVSDCPLGAIEPSDLYIVSTVASGEFVIGSKTVPINRAVAFQGGLEAETTQGAGATSFLPLPRSELAPQQRSGPSEEQR